MGRVPRGRDSVAFVGDLSDTKSAAPPRPAGNELNPRSRGGGYEGSVGR